MLRAYREGRKWQTRRLVSDAWPWHDGRPDVRDGTKYGVPGDQLWVKEALVRRDELVRYAYDNDVVLLMRGGAAVEWPWKPAGLPAMYCPRWASRTTLEVLAVRAERVQDITEADAIAEGVGSVEEYQRLWDGLNSHRAPWALNPWVWVIDFPRLEVSGE